MATSEEESFQLESSVRGHHGFKSTWTPVVRQLLQVQAKAVNSHDAYAMAVILNNAVVGHLPRKFSRIAFFFSNMVGILPVKLQEAGGSLMFITKVWLFHVIIHSHTFLIHSCIPFSSIYPLS